MAKRKYIGLPNETMVEVIGFSKGKTFKKVVSLSEALEIKKRKSKVIIYQLGFSQFRDAKEI